MTSIRLAVAASLLSIIPFHVYAQSKDNAEITTLFNADQNERQDPAHINWKILNPRDAERRKILQKMINNGALKTAQDYYHAAYIFQHGQEPNDFLLAHCLAFTSIAKGNKDPDAAWIAAATLDRFLQFSKKPQIYGTQTLIPHSGPPTLEPYDRTLISDSMRAAANVPPLKQQDIDLKATEAEFAPIKPH